MNSNFNYKYNELEKFIKEHGCKPTLKSNKSLSVWINTQVGNSNKNKENKEKVINLLKQNGLMGKIGLKKRDWEDTFNLLNNYLKANKDFKNLTNDEIINIFGININSWIAQNTTKNVPKNKREKVSRLVSEYDLLKRKATLSDDFLNLFGFAFDNKIRPNHLSMFKAEKTTFDGWILGKRRLFFEKDVELKKSVTFFGENKLKSYTENDFYFDELKLILDLIDNSIYDLEMVIKSSKNLYLIVSKENNSYNLNYEFSYKPKNKTNKTINPNDLFVCDFLYSININVIVLYYINHYKYILDQNDELIKNMNNFNLNLSYSKIKLKEIIKKEIGFFYYNNLSDIIQKTWNDAVFEYFKNNSRDKNTIHLFLNLDNSQVDIAKNINVTRERVRQIMSKIQKLFYINFQKNKIDFKSILVNDATDKQKKENIMTNRNKIYFGPPGTGKSYKIFKEIKSNKKFVCMFNDEYSYFDFMGQYKPVMYTINRNNKTQIFDELNNIVDKYEDKEPIIVYNFVPGIFIQAYIEAKKTTEDVFLIIEEINRGNCSSIFGDLFQLLDRDDNGESLYSINTSSEVSSFLKYQGVENYNELKLPSNLKIISTMNTSDQSLFKMDSAFKRRWDLDFIDINYNEEQLMDTYIENTNILWVSFLKKINDLIINTLESENKCIGQWFIIPENINNKKMISEKKFKNVFLQYLYFDVFHNDREIIFKGKNFSKIITLSINEIISDILEEN